MGRGPEKGARVGIWTRDTHCKVGLLSSQLCLDSCRQKFKAAFFYLFIYLFLSFLPFFSRAASRMEVPRLGVELELQPPACTRATATGDLSRICDLHHSSQQHWILSPLSKARDRTHNFMIPSQIC